MAEHPKPFGPDLMLGLAQHEVADGIKILGHVGNEDVLVVRRGTEYFAVTARCTHDHGPLVGGLIVGNSIRCPWHHACFDLSTGEALEAPAFDPLSCWVVECRDGKIFVRSKYDQPKLSVGRKVGRSSPDKIDDEKFINLIRRMLKAGFVEDWKHNPTYSGTPQGGVVSPLLANIYLHELDEYMGTVQAGFDKEKLRSAPPEYWRLSGRIQHRWKRIHRLRAEGHGDDPAIDADLRDIEAAHAQRDALPARDPFDPNFRQTAVLPLCR